jgi:membrane dipeptidase
VPDTHDPEAARIAAAEAARIHAATLTLDTHVDIPWPDTPDPAGDTGRRVDFPKMRRGGAARR